MASDILTEADCTCTPGEGCDEEGDPGCTYCRSIDSEWQCPAEATESGDEWDSARASAITGNCEDYSYLDDEAGADKEERE